VVQKLAQTALASEKSWHLFQHVRWQIQRWFSLLCSRQACVDWYKLTYFDHLSQSTRRPWPEPMQNEYKTTYSTDMVFNTYPSGSQTCSSRYPNQGADYVLLP